MKKESAPVRKQRDLEAWELWKREWDDTGDEANQHWPDLFKRMKGAVDMKLRDYGGKVDVPEAVIKNLAFQGVVDGVKTYDPTHSSGSALFTHVVNKVNEHVRRPVQQAQNAGHRTPEHRGYGARREFHSAVEEFEAINSYQPNDQELAGFVKQEKNRFSSLYKQIKRNPEASIARFRNDVVQSAPGVSAAIGEAVSVNVGKEDYALQQVRYQLSTGLPQDEQLLKVMNMSNSGKTGKQISKALGITEPQVSVLKRKVVGMLDKEMSRRR